MRLVNCTGYRIIMSDDQGRVTNIIPPSSHAARLEGATQSLTSVDNVRIDQITPDRITGLPDPEADVVYIVNPDVARATDRDDVVTPEMSDDSAHLVADTYVGVRRLLSIRKSDVKRSSG